MRCFCDSSRPSFFPNSNSERPLPSRSLSSALIHGHARPLGIRRASAARLLFFCSPVPGQKTFPGEVSTLSTHQRINAYEAKSTLLNVARSSRFQATSHRGKPRLARQPSFPNALRPPRAHSALASRVSGMLAPTRPSAARDMASREKRPRLGQ